MARSGPEIQDALRGFVSRWSSYAGGERAEAQTFLNELFACYGLDRQASGARFEDFTSSAGFMDLHWPGICIVEMKAPHRDVSVAHEQMVRYRNESADYEQDIPAARWVVLCNFRTFEIWEPGNYPLRPRATVDLATLPDRYDVLLFLAGPAVEPVFVEHHRDLTTKAAQKIAEMFHSLADRVAAPADELQRFVMQAVWCLFAEDLGMLDGWPLQSTVKRLLQQPGRSSAAEIGFLFRVLNQKGSHNRRDLLAGTTYVNGELFAQPAEVELDRRELRLLLDASAFDWRVVDPTIFGSLMEGVLGHDRRWELGAHYTHEADIMKIVTPTIVRPWQQRIDAATSPDAARSMLDDLCGFKVLDPACGCGNFLYVAYRELRSLEHLLKQRMRELARATGLPLPVGPLPYIPLSNMQGIDIEQTAVMIARVTLWMGHRQMIERYGAAEDPLPLITLSSVQVGDALWMPWPQTNCIIGNPPFLGSQHIREAMGDDYIERLKREFGVGVKDFCVYWFRRAVDHLRPGERAGLVGTKSVSQNRARSASLQYVLEKGGVITDAVANQKWPGEAKVHVSLVNWINLPNAVPDTFTIDGETADGIGADLREALPGGWTPNVLAANRGKCFQGPIPVGAGFVVDDAQAQELRHANSAAVVRPYLTASDITDDPHAFASRSIIDFGQMPLEEAKRYSAALAVVRQRVKPERERNRDRRFREEWWRFGRPRVEMRDAIRGLDRYAVIAAHAKRVSIVWEPEEILASNACMIFAFNDDFAMGVLQSRTHVAWAWHQASTLKGDLRYTPTSVFMTFPWPDGATPEQRLRVVDACRRLLARRCELCLAAGIGLTRLYNAMDEGA